MRRSVILCLLMTLIAGATTAQSQSPPPGFRADEVIFDVQSGTILRAGAALDAPPVYTVWQRVTARGQGVCTEEACSLKFHDRDVFAERARIAIMRHAQADPSTVALNDDQDYPAGWLRLRVGDRGDAVKELQTLLVKEGASLTPDGVFGPATEAAVRDLQRRWRIEVDGAAGLRTLYLLGVIGAPAQVRTTSF